MKKTFLMIFCCALMQAQSNHHLMTDSEFSSDRSFTQYILHDYAREGKVVGMSSMILALRAADGSHFLQVAAGPRLQGKRWFLNTYFGGAKGGRIVTVALAKVDLPGKLELIAASDPKFPVGNLGKAPEIWFSRVWLGRGHFFLRHDNLQVAGHGNETSKAGVELRHKIGSRLELYSFAYHDYQKHDWGATIGSRVKIR